MLLSSLRPHWSVWTNRVERIFNKRKQARRIATRYDKTALSFASFINLASARLWLKSYGNRA